MGPAAAGASSSSAFVSRFEEALAEGAVGLSPEAKRKRAEELADSAAQDASEQEGITTLLCFLCCGLV